MSRIWRFIGPSVLLLSCLQAGLAAAADVPLITDRRVIGIPQTDRYPAKGEAVKDPATGFVVTRVADSTELVGDRRPSRMSLIVYSRYTPVNTTGEYVLVHGENSTSAWIYRVADNKMMTVLRFRPSAGSASPSLGEVNELRWDYSGEHPYRLYFVGRALSNGQGNGENVGMSFYYLDFDPKSATHGAPVLVRDFSASFPGAGSTVIMNDVEGDSSNDSRYWAWQVMDTSFRSGYRTYAIFTYDKVTDTILGSLQRSCDRVRIPCTAIESRATPAPHITRPNMVEMSPLGTRVVVHYGRVYDGTGLEAEIGTVTDGPKAFLPDFKDPVRISVDATHSGWAWGPNGEEMFVSQNNRNDWIEAVDIRSNATANCHVISGNSYSCGVKLIAVKDLDPSYSLGFHFGKFYDRSKRGYVYMNTYDSNHGAWGKNQSMLLAIGNPPAGRPRLVRLGSTYNTAIDYRSEGSGALDFAGNSIWTTANWGFKDGRGDVFRIQLPTDLFRALGR